MSNNILLYSVIIFSLLFIIIMILLMVYPEIYDYLIFLSSLILIIISLLSFKCMNQEQCKCKKNGKGHNNEQDCPICGGVNVFNLKQNRENIIKLINAIRNDKEDIVNDILTNEIKMPNCSQQNDPLELLRYMFGGIGIIDLHQVLDDYYFISNDMQITTKEDAELLPNQLQFITFDNSQQFENNNFKPDNYNLRAFIIHTGKKTETSSYGHYVAYVQYKSGWYYCSDRNIEKKQNLDEIYNELAQLTNSTNVTVKLIVFAKDNKPLNENNPFELTNFGNYCYNNSTLQILLATDLLSDTTTKKSNKLIEYEKIIADRQQKEEEILKKQRQDELNKITPILLKLNLNSQEIKLLSTYIINFESDNKFQICGLVYTYLYIKYISKDSDFNINIEDNKFTKILDKYRNQFNIKSDNINEFYNKNKSEIDNLIIKPTINSSINPSINTLINNPVFKKYKYLISKEDLNYLQTKLSDQNIYSFETGLIGEIIDKSKLLPDQKNKLFQDIQEKNILNIGDRLNYIDNIIEQRLSPEEEKKIIKLVNELSNLPQNVRIAIINYTRETATKENFNKFIDIYYYFYKEHLEKMYNLMGNPNISIVEIIENLKNQYIHETITYPNIDKMHNQYKNDINNYKSASVIKAEKARQNYKKGYFQTLKDKIWSSPTPNPQDLTMAARKAQEDAARKAQEDATRKVQADADRKAQEDDARKAQEDIDRKAQADKLYIENIKKEIDEFLKVIEENFINRYEELNARYNIDQDILKKEFDDIIEKAQIVDKFERINAYSELIKQYRQTVEDKIKRKLEKDRDNVYKSQKKKHIQFKKDLNDFQNNSSELTFKRSIIIPLDDKLNKDSEESDWNEFKNMFNKDQEMTKIKEEKNKKKKAQTYDEFINDKNNITPPLSPTQPTITTQPTTQQIIQPGVTTQPIVTTQPVVTTQPTTQPTTQQIIQPGVTTQPIVTTQPTIQPIKTKTIYSSGLPAYEVPFKQIQEYWENKSTSKKNINIENKLTPFDVKFGNV